MIFVCILFEIAEKFVIPVSLIGGISAIIVFASQQLIKSFAASAEKRIQLEFDKELKKHEFELSQRKSEFDAFLNKDLKEHELKFSKLHAERADLIKNMYVLIYEMHTGMLHYVDIMQEGDWAHNPEREQNAVNKYITAQDTFERNRFFLNKETCGLIDDILTETRSSISEMRGAQFHQRLISEARDVPPAEQAEVRKRWRTLSESVALRVQEVREMLADNFREIIGVK